jgi:hypothetical protein
LRLYAIGIINSAAKICKQSSGLTIHAIDLQKHRRLVVSQVLNFGTKEATDWLFKVYGKDKVREIASEIPTGQWDKKSLALWSLVLDFTTKSRAERILNG